MARLPRELTPEERAQLEKNNKRQVSVAAAILWTVCAVAFAVTVGFDVANANPILKVVLHGVCALLTGTASVMHFVRWRKMKAAEAAETVETAAEDTDSTDTP